jgi:nitroreductase
LEPIRPGEDEAAAALRLLGRMRRLYGPRFFDAITVDAWYATGPFIQAVQRLGWGVVAVLKQERYDIYGEATRLSAGAVPQRFEWEGRQVCLKE